MRPIRSYQRSVWAVRPVNATTSLIVYRSCPSGRGCAEGAEAHMSARVEVVSITVMAPRYDVGVHSKQAGPGAGFDRWDSESTLVRMQSLAMIENWPVPTAAAAVVRADGTVAGTHGPTDRRFPLASVTKPLAAYAVLVAYEEGAVELDEPAGPEGATVRHLLAHTSGLAFDEHRIQAAPGA